MVINIISSKTIVEAAIRDFNISYQGWINDAIEWIGYGIIEIGANPVFNNEVKHIQIQNYKYHMFCDAELLIDIFDIHDCKINYISDGSKKSQLFEQDNGGIYPPSVGTVTVVKPIHSLIDWWKIDGEWLKFSFTDRKIKLVYKNIQQDDEGFPCIPDDVYVIEALKWKIINQLLMRGNKHPVIDIKFSMQMWMDKKQQAKNHLNMPTPYQMKNLMRNSITMIPKINRI